jgi:hypothetical protein
VRARGIWYASCLMSLARLLAAAALLASGCASTPRAYPPRAPRCALLEFRAAAPGLAAWDDIGVAQVACHIDVPPPQCMQRLRAEACRMGGDILYNVPTRPLRPQDQVFIYRAQVAHTRGKGITAPEPSPLPEDSAGPVVPLVVPAPREADAGASG